MATLTPSDAECDRCGHACKDGFEERYYGTDPETGDHDTQVICRACLDEEAESAEDEDRYAAGDQAFTERFEES
jgi:hypothetical protein